MVETIDADRLFYERLPAFDHFDRAASPEQYTDVPDSWWVVISDIRGSTKAIEAGRYKDVNILGAATITAVLNAVKGTEIPYVFGGDGATLLIPASLKAKAEVALRTTQALARTAFDMELRAGLVSVRLLREAGRQLGVAKHRVSEHIQLAMFSGGALAYAETLIKDEVKGVSFRLSPAEGDRGENAFAGLECRWEPVPSKRGEILTLIVKALSGDAQGAAGIYRSVIAKVDELFPPDGGGRPVETPQLTVSVSARDLGAEARVRHFEDPSKPRWWQVLKLKLIGYFGRWVFRKGGVSNGVDWSQYQREVAANTDSRKFDDVLRMILDGTRAQRDALTAWLDAEEAAGRLVYGLHITSSALLTCLVFARQGRHVHFVDGSDGGYAMAAKMLKSKMARRP